MSDIVTGSKDFFCAASSAERHRAFGDFCSCFAYRVLYGINHLFILSVYKTPVILLMFIENGLSFRQICKIHFF